MVTLKFRALCKKCRSRAHFALGNFDDSLILACFDGEYTCPVTGHGHYFDESVIVEVSVNGGKWEVVEE